MAEHPLGVLGTARLDLQPDRDLAEVQVGRRPLVDDVEDVGLEVGELAQQRREAAGPVRDEDAEVEVAARRRARRGSRQPA